MKYIALIQKRGDHDNKSYLLSDSSETKEEFVERVKNCYIRPYFNTSTPYYWKVDVYELGDKIL